MGIRAYLTDTSWLFEQNPATGETYDFGGLLCDEDQQLTDLDTPAASLPSLSSTTAPTVSFTPCLGICTFWPCSTCDFHIFQA